MPRFPCARIALLLSLLASSASAHDTWMLGRVQAGANGTDLRFELTSGMDFPAPESPIAAARVERAEVQVGTVRSPLTATEDANWLRLEAQGVPEGLALATVVLAPRELSLDPSQVDEYLAELDADATVRAAYARSGQWRERYRKNATALLRVGANGAAPAPSAPQGLALELVALDAPDTLASGAPLRACLYAAGQALPAHRVGLIGPRGTAHEWQDTDAQGGVSFAWHQPGPHLLRAIRLRPATQAGLDWDSDFATLSLEIPER